MELRAADFQANIVDYYENMRDTHWNPRFTQLSLDLANRLLRVQASCTSLMADRWPEAKLTRLHSSPADLDILASRFQTQERASQSSSGDGGLITFNLLKFILCSSLSMGEALGRITSDMNVTNAWPLLQQTFSKPQSLFLLLAATCPSPHMDLNSQLFNPCVSLNPAFMKLLTATAFPAMDLSLIRLLQNNYNPFLLKFPLLTQAPRYPQSQSAPIANYLGVNPTNPLQALLPAPYSSLQCVNRDVPSEALRFLNTGGLLTDHLRPLCPAPALPSQLPVFRPEIGSLPTLSLFTPDQFALLGSSPATQTRLFGSVALPRGLDGFLNAVPAQPSCTRLLQQYCGHNRQYFSHLQVVLFKDEAKTRFMCPKCNKQWTSMKGAITFVVILSHQLTAFRLLHWTLQPGSNVLFELFPQACADCSEKGPPILCQPKWYPEEIDKVLRNLFVNIHRTFYRNVINWDQQFDRRRRPGHPTGRHDNTKCIACLNGMCVSNMGGGTGNTCANPKQLPTSAQASSVDADECGQCESSPACKRRLMPSSRGSTSSQ